MIFKNKNQNKNKAFVILFAVTISSIILAIALGVANISFREMRFSTSVKDSNNAFFAADSGLEFVLMNDKYPPIVDYPVGATSYENIFGLDSAGRSCARVAITKTTTSTTVISKGFSAGVNNSGVCSPSGNSVERELRATYGI